ncbi:MAG: hypothetical protein RLZZ350_379 [Verrucomicrobiota bacterium]
MLIVATACWALSFPVMKALALTQQKLLPDVSSWFFTSLGVVVRFSFAGLLLLPFVWRELKTISRRELEHGLVLAVFGASGILFQMDGLAYTTASTSAFLTQGYCIFIPLWVALSGRSWPSGKVFVSVALVVLGVAVLAGINLHSLKVGRGELETLVASLLFTGQILALEHPRYAANRPLIFSLVLFFAMAIFTVPLLLATAPSVAACVRAYAAPAAVGFMAALVLVSTLGGYLLMNRWQRAVTATEAGLIYCVEPVIASVLSLFLPALFSAWADINYGNEQLTVRLLLGGGLITVANIILQRR